MGCRSLIAFVLALAAACTQHRSTRLSVGEPQCLIPQLERSAAADGPLHLPRLGPLPACLGDDKCVGTAQDGSVVTYDSVSGQVVASLKTASRTATGPVDTEGQPSGVWTGTYFYERWTITASGGVATGAATWRAGPDDQLIARASGELVDGHRDGRWLLEFGSRFRVEAMYVMGRREGLWTYRCDEIVMTVPYVEGRGFDFLFDHDCNLQSIAEVRPGTKDRWTLSVGKDGVKSFCLTGEGVNGYCVRIEGYEVTRDFFGANGRPVGPEREFDGEGGWRETCNES